MKIISLLFVLITCGFLFTASYPAYAWSGGMDYREFEKAFSSSPFVFIGVAGNPTEEGTPFEVIEVFKSPWKESLKIKTVLINKPRHPELPANYVGPIKGTIFDPDTNIMDFVVTDQIIFKTGMEYLLLVDKPQEVNSVFYGEVDDERSYMQTVAGQMKFMQETANSDLFKSPGHTIFNGRVKKISQLKSLDATIVQFEILKVHQSSDKKSELKQGVLVSVYVYSCADVFHLDQDYFLYMQRDSRSLREREMALENVIEEDRNKFPKNLENINHIANCWEVSPLNEIAILRELSSGGYLRWMKSLFLEN